ncbi:hypothetical protein H8356DRAFT_1325385 [Neocallimastix lanati (nom. inval.)]|nr:hypothetical protein H8356DRAFT_1325385 [Neocallimastix sp. JGI-2020a]
MSFTNKINIIVSSYIVQLQHYKQSEDIEGFILFRKSDTLVTSYQQKCRIRKIWFKEIIHIFTDKLNCFIQKNIFDEECQNMKKYEISVKFCKNILNN